MLNGYKILQNAEYIWAIWARTFRPKYSPLLTNKKYMPILSRCSHGQPITMFCLHEQCPEPDSGGCSQCFKTGHQTPQHTNQSILHRSHLEELYERLTADPDTKLKSNILQESIYSYFLIVKSQLDASIDAVSRVMTNNICHPYLNHHNQLAVYRCIKNKQLHKLTKKDLREFDAFASKVDKAQMQNMERDLYFQQVHKISKAVQEIKVSLNIYQDALKIFNLKFEVEDTFFQKILNICSEIRLHEHEYVSRNLKVCQPVYESPEQNKRRNRKVSIDQGLSLEGFHYKKGQKSNRSQRNKSRNSQQSKSISEDDKIPHKDTLQVPTSGEDREKSQDSITSSDKKSIKKPANLKLSNGNTKLLSEMIKSEQSNESAKKDIQAYDIHLFAQSLIPEPETKQRMYSEGDQVRKKKVKIPVVGFSEEDEMASPIYKKKMQKKSLNDLILFRIESANSDDEKDGQTKQGSLDKCKQEEIVDQHDSIKEQEEQECDLCEDEVQSIAFLIESLPMDANRAVFMLEKALKKASNNLSAAQYLSYLYLQVGKPKLCLNLCNKMLEQIEGSKQAKELSMHLNNNKAAALNALGRYSESISFLEKIVMKDGRDIEFKNLADAYFCIGIHEKAILNYQKAVLMNPTMHEAEYNFALCLYMVGEMKEAKRRVQKAITLNPHNQIYQELSQQIMTKATF